MARRRLGALGPVRGGRRPSVETSDQDIRRPRSLLAPCLLLLLAEREGHGYELVERLGCLGFDWDAKPGPTYGELRKLEGAGLVASTWDLGTRGPARRVYQLTGTGRRALQAAAQDMAAVAELAETYRRRYAGLAPPPPGPDAAAPRSRRRGGRSTPGQA